MKRLLLGLLLICTLTSNLAWAWDSHVQAPSHPVVSEHGFVFFGADEFSDDPAQNCHYCGCGLAHVLGFFAAATSIVAMPKGESFADAPAILVSYTTLPPVKPPRS